MHLALPRHPTLRRASAVAVLATVLAAAPLAHAAAKTWNGNTDANLATGANWDASTAPASGDSWVFGAAGSSGVALANNLATSTAYEVAGISFGSASGAYAISGGAFTLTGNIVSTAASSAVTIGSNIAISGSRQVNLNGGASTAHVILSGNLSGTGTLTQTAGGTGAKNLTFSGDNSGFTGAFVQNNDGNNRTAFSTATAGSSSAAWTFNRNVNGGTALNFTNATIHFGSLSGGGFIRANSVGTVTVSVGALDTSTTFSGILQQGNGTQVLALTKVGTGTLTLSGNNAYTGATTINSGTLALGAANRINDASNLVLNGGTFSTGGFSETLGTLALNGTSLIDFGAGASALVFANSSALAWTGTLTLSNFEIGTDSLRFGIGNTALTSLQLGSISLPGYTAGLDANGFVIFAAIPEPSATAALLGGAALGAVALRRRPAHRR